VSASLSIPVDRFIDYFSRSHAPRGNAVKARCAASHVQRAYTGRSASSTAFPRSTWERGVDGVSQAFVYNDESSRLRTQ